ncbi:MAG: DUF192 domain-containing protein, partial [bacterium]|nr:DUF192 domain-containing protein [bacterium]
MRSPWINIFLLLLVISLALFWFFKKERADLKSGETLVKIGGAEYRVEVADSPALKAKGLSGRADLARDEGMLFPFSPPSRVSFWMRGMVIPIDIIWIANGEVIGFEENVPVLSGNGVPTYRPSESVDYVLEVNAGEVEKRGI